MIIAGRPKEPRYLFEAKVDAYIEWMRNIYTKTDGNRLSENTIREYSDRVKQLKNIIESSDDFGNTREAIEKVNKRLKARGNGRERAAFKMWLQFLGEDPDDPKSGLRLLVKVKRRPSALTSVQELQKKVLTRRELKLVLEGCKQRYNRFLISFLYDTACRSAEALGVIVDRDIEFSPHQEDHDKGIYARVSVRGKGNKNRTVYLSKYTVDLLHERAKDKQWYKEGKVMRGFAPGEPLFNFINQRTGKKAASQYDGMKNHIKRIHKTILGRHITPHCYRHTRITHMLDDGAELYFVSRYAGHENIQTTMIYAHFSEISAYKAFAQSKGVAEG